MSKTFSSNDPMVLMEVCGTHTHELFRTGIRFSLPTWVKLISGPGCPVCVTDDRDLAKAIAIARTYNVTILSFGDMLKVPTQFGSLATLRAEGKKVEVVYSPVDAVSYALDHTEEKCVFFAVGFETTMPAVAAALEDTVKKHIPNLFFLINHKTVLPALDALLASDRVNIDGLILPGHVSAIIGRKVYEPVLEKHRIPGVITGFTREQMIRGINVLIHLVLKSQVSVINAYPEVVREEGNKKAQELIDKYFIPSGAYWRGLGYIPNSAMKLKSDFEALDAEVQFPVVEPDVRPIPGCRCADVVIGAVDPAECPLFKKICAPYNPVGPCMVSSEGACAAWYRYGEVRING